MYRTVDIGRKRMSGKELEEILLKAAKDVGFRARSIDQFEKKYSLDPVPKEQKVYAGTIIMLRGRILPIAKISGIEKRLEISKFGITIPLFSFRSPKQIKKYLNAVYEHIYEPVNIPKTI